MTSATFPLNCANNLQNCLVFIQKQALNGENEVTIRKAGVGKTLQQLGALFGVWIEYIKEQTGYTTNEIHRDLKRNFLARIYCEEPHGKAQTAWVELLYYLQEKQDWEAVRMHADTISLRWASCKQMKRYMDQIQQYYISNDMPLPIPDRFHRVYR